MVNRIIEPMNLTMSNGKIISFISMLEYECKIYSLYENFLFENKMKEFAEMKRRKRLHIYQRIMSQEVKYSIRLLLDFVLFY